MKIGIWGSYNKGNFGDDLMAFMISSHLSKQGHEVFLYNSTKELSIECSCESIDDLDDFVESSDVVVIGGGGMLINNSFIRFLAKKLAFDFEVSFYNLYRSLVKHNRQLFCVSIGGDGNAYLNNPYKRLLFKPPVCVGGTVRLSTDLNSVDPKLFHYVPDIVLHASSFFESESVSNPKSRKRIVLNLKKGSEDFLHKVQSDFGNDVDFFTFGSHLPTFKNGYELVSVHNHFTYSSLATAIDFLRSADLIISSKLHVGVTGLSFGVPFVSYKGPIKAMEFLRSENLDKFICLDRTSVYDLISSQAISLDSRLKKSVVDSYRHFSFLDSFIRSNMS